MLIFRKLNNSEFNISALTQKIIKHFVIRDLNNFLKYLYFYIFNVKWSKSYLICNKWSFVKCSLPVKGFNKTSVSNLNSIVQKRIQTTKTYTKKTPWIFTCYELRGCNRQFHWIMYSLRKKDHHHFYQCFPIASKYDENVFFFPLISSHTDKNCVTRYYHLRLEHIR